MPFGEHLRELRKRFTYVAIAVIGWSVAAALVERQIVAVLLQPSNGERFIYTSPLGGVNFLFNVCIYTGIALSIPVIVYQFLRYIEPLMQKSSARFVRLGSLMSGMLAIAGVVFGYFIGLPAALNFLLHQSVVSSQIHAQLTIEAYLSFVSFYMLGAALMFQVPLLIVCINRITPLKPQQLLRHERWAILFAVVLALVMNPTPNLFDQLFVAGPIILTYQLGILIVWWQNRTPNDSRKLQVLRAKDVKAQAKRAAHLPELQGAWRPAGAVAMHVKPATAVSFASQATAPKPITVPAPHPKFTVRRRPHQYLDALIADRGTPRQLTTRLLPS